MEIKQNQKVKIVSKDRIIKYKSAYYLDGEKIYPSLNMKGDMDYMFGTIQTVLAVNNDSVIIRKRNKSNKVWYVSLKLIEKIVTKEEYPEYFL